MSTATAPTSAASGSSRNEAFRTVHPDFLRSPWHAWRALSVSLLETLSCPLITRGIATKPQDAESKTTLLALVRELRALVVGVKLLDSKSDKTELSESAYLFVVEEEPWSSLCKILPPDASQDAESSVKTLQHL